MTEGLSSILIISSEVKNEKLSFKVENIMYCCSVTVWATLAHLLRPKEMDFFVESLWLYIIFIRSQIILLV